MSCDQVRELRKCWFPLQIINLAIHFIYEIVLPPIIQWSLILVFLEVPLDQCQHILKIVEIIKEKEYWQEQDVEAKEYGRVWQELFFVFVSENDQALVQGQHCECQCDENGADHREFVSIPFYRHQCKSKHDESNSEDQKWPGRNDWFFFLHPVEEDQNEPTYQQEEWSNYVEYSTEEQHIGHSIRVSTFIGEDRQFSVDEVPL